ncbi:MAG: helix-turn-helix domain-containing protein [Clostridiales bacterium]|nr:helix-turn-helix domain-containing protein [Clostridiales bacterium]
MALHNAGWSNVKIAEEMGCSARSVCQIVKEEQQK